MIHLHTEIVSIRPGGIFLVIFLLIVSFMLLGCSEKNDPTFVDRRIGPVSVRKYDYPPGGDPSIPPELGGPGFERIAEDLGWETGEAEPAGSPDAKKGGRFTISFSEFPATLRTEGKDCRSSTISFIGNLVYERLLDVNSQDLTYAPSLATHWKISEDGQTFWYRIDPNARWSDGMPVTSRDVAATWRLLVDEGILEPYSNRSYREFTEPEPVSAYIVKTSARERNWRHFLSFSAGMKIYPAHYLDNLKGEEYLEKYQFDMLPGTGPFVLDRKKMRKGKSLALVRRSDYWARKYPFALGYANFDEIRILIVPDSRLTLEKFKKGEIDLFLIGRAQWWIQEFDLEKPDFDALYRGLIRKRKIFNHDAKGIGGLAMNIRRAPFRDIRVRKAIERAWDREKLITALFFNEYKPRKSYFTGGLYENPDLPLVRFDLEEAARLLREAGWIERNEDGFLVRNGKILEIEMGISQAGERIYTVLQEDLAKIGIKLDLKFVTPQTMYKKIRNERDFDIQPQSWTGLTFPNPETHFHSGMGDIGGTANVTGLKNDRIDELCMRYKREFDPSKRIELIWEIDRILLEQVPYALSWYEPYTERIAYWNKFGMPDSYLGHSGDWRSCAGYWWFDQEKATALEKAKRDRSITFSHGEIEVHYDRVMKRDENTGGS